jgi:tetratricopeptide (TPR) repeat protein
MERRAVIAALVVVAVTAAVYLPTLTNDFSGLDDDVYITANPLLASFSLRNLGAILTRPYAEFYHPVTMLSLAVDRLIWGFNAFGFHLTDLILHLLNTFLVFWVCWQLVRAGQAGDLPFSLFNSLPREARDAPVAGEGRQVANLPHTAPNLARTAAAITAALFGLHPLHVESVAWAAQRKDLLCAFFYLLALGLYLRHAEQERQRLGRLAYRLSLAAFLLALLSKSLAVTLPLVLVLVDYYPLRRLRRWPRRGITPDERGVWLEKLPFLGLAVAIGIVTLAAQATGGSIRSGAEIPWSLRPWLAIHSYAFYLWKALVPTRLTVLYPIPLHAGLGDAATWLALAGLTSITAAAWLSRRRRPSLTAAWVFYIITLAPVCGLVAFGAQSVADRYSYLPLLGPFLLVGLLVGQVENLSSRRNRAGGQPAFDPLPAFAFAATLVVLAALGYLTNRQVGYWHDGDWLWRHHLRIYPDNVRVRFCLGYFYQSHGRVGEAMREYERCLRIEPNHFDACINFGSLLLKDRDAESAAECFRRAIEARPDNAGAHLNLGLALVALERQGEAIEQFTEAVSLNPRYAEAHASLGQALAETGQMPGAIKAFRTALGLKPDLTDVHESLAFAYLAVGRKEDARTEFKRTIALRPRSPDALIELGLLDAASSHPIKALENLTQAARYRPGDAEIHLLMAKTVWENGALGLAESSLRQAIRVDPDCIEAYYQLGLLYEQMERYADALAALDRGWEALQYMRKPTPEKFAEAYRRLDAKVKSLEPEE